MKKSKIDKILLGPREKFVTIDTLKTRPRRTPAKNEPWIELIFYMYKLLLQ